MAPRGRRKKAGLMREDAARDAMRAFGFEERVIKMCIKELLELYGEGGWFLIEEFSYSVLLNKCLEKQADEENNVAEEEEQISEEQNVQMAQEEEEEEEVEEEQEQQVEDGRDHVGSNSTSLVGCGAETGEASVVDYASPPVAFQSSDCAHHSTGGAKRCGGWISDEEETDPDEDSVVDDDDGEMIHLTPEPLCEELKELLREVRGEEKKRKRPTRWDT